MRLIDEIITQTAYLDFESSDPIEYVALSMEAHNQIVKEVAEEIDKQYIDDDDLERCLSMKYVLMPSLNSIDYRFLKEVKL